MSPGFEGRAVARSGCAFAIPPPADVSSSNATWSCASRRNSGPPLSVRRAIRLASKAALATGSASAHLHQLQTRILRHLLLGVRQGEEVAVRRRQRAAHRRRRRHPDSCRRRRRRAGVRPRRARGGPPREGRTRAGPRGLVSAVCGVLPVLPRSSAAAASPFSTHRDAPAVSGLKLSAMRRGRRLASREIPDPSSVSGRPLS